MPLHVACHHPWFEQVRAKMIQKRSAGFGQFELGFLCGILTALIISAVVMIIPA